MDLKELRHLLSRGGFGLSLQDLQRYKGASREKVVEGLLADSKSISLFDVDLSAFFDEANQISIRNKKDLLALIKNSKEKFLELNNQWLDGIMSTEAPLRERMMLFWANHFVCRDSNVYHMQLYLNTLKTHALGNFGDFVKAVSKQAAMLKYLNGRQNRKLSPNENFARELMELFTLGEGQYTEKDIKESARAFTGYSHNFQGDFVFRRFQHDSGSKLFLGQRGNFNGDEIIDSILEQKQCARFICSKLYRYFVNPIPNKEHVEQLTEVFYKDYDIANLMRFLFLQDWFYDSVNQGIKIKSPVDLLASAYRLWPYEFKEDRAYIKVQKLLGQSLLDPPNVAGWPGDRAWIDTNTLMIRLKLPSLIYQLQLSNGKPMSGIRSKKSNPLSSTCDAGFPKQQYGHLSDEALEDLVLFQKPGASSVVSKSDPVALRLLKLMSLPEFQLC